MPVSDTSPEVATTTAGESPSGFQRACVVALILGVWVLVRLVCWTGYAGADDLIYARYAHDFHRVPMNHMEFRMPVVLSLRAAMAVGGPSEAGACLAPLAYSLMLLVAVAWFVGWPKELSFRTTGAMLLACLIPIDVTFASYPSPAAVSAGLSALGMTCILRGNKIAALLGGLLLGLAFMTHFLNFYLVALFCLTAVACDFRRYWIGVLAAFLCSSALLAAEMTTYHFLAGNAFAHIDALKDLPPGIPEDGRSESKLGFFLAPVQILVLSKHFGFGLLLLLLCGGLRFKRFDTPQRILWITTIGFWFWLGYGTMNPFDYRPASRGMHYYTPLAFGLCALLPFALEAVFARRRIFAFALYGLLLAVFGASLLLGGAWGSSVDCSKQLLGYAQAHPEQRFLTDVYTLNEMYCRNGFELPPNIVVLNSVPQRTHLLINKEPEGVPKLTFEHPEQVDAILVNLSRSERPAEAEFESFLKQRGGPVIERFPPGLRLAFQPFAKWFADRGFALRDRGAEVRALKPAAGDSKAAADSTQVTP